MKLKNNLALLISGLIFILISGCYERNYTVKTKINPDGSIERTYLIEKDDSASVYTNPFPLNFDSTWKVEVKKVNDSISAFVFSAKKYFHNSDELLKDIEKSNSIDKLYNSFSLQKHFRWFYTYFDYEETYKENLPYNNIPADKFFTPEELQQIYADTISKSLDIKMEAWWQKNIFEEYFKVLEKSAKQYNTPDFNLSLLNSKKDSLYDALIGSDTKSENVMAICEKVLGTNKVINLKDDFKSVENNLSKNFELMLKLNGNYVNEIILPGIIINTNAKTIEGNKLSWKFSNNIILIKMTARSRMINTWAFIIAGAVILIILIGLALPIIKKRRSFLE